MGRTVRRPAVRPCPRPVRSGCPGSHSGQGPARATAHRPILTPPRPPPKEPGDVPPRDRASHPPARRPARRASPPASRPPSLTVFEGLTPDSGCTATTPPSRGSPKACASWLADINGRDQVALVAWLADRPGGIARYYRVDPSRQRRPWPWSAERTRRGIGGALVDALAEHAVGGAIAELVFDITGTDAGALQLARSRGTVLGSARRPCTGRAPPSSAVARTCARAHSRSLVVRRLTIPVPLHGAPAEGRSWRLFRSTAVLWAAGAEDHHRQRPEAYNRRRRCARRPSSVAAPGLTSPTRGERPWHRTRPWTGPASAQVRAGVHPAARANAGARAASVAATGGGGGASAARSKVRPPEWVLVRSAGLRDGHDPTVPEDRRVGDRARRAATRSTTRPRRRWGRRNSSTPWSPTTLRARRVERVEVGPHPRAERAPTSSHRRRGDQAERERTILPPPG